MYRIRRKYFFVIFKLYACCIVCCIVLAVLQAWGEYRGHSLWKLKKGEIKCLCSLSKQLVRFLFGLSFSAAHWGFVWNSFLCETRQRCNVQICIFLPLLDFLSPAFNNLLCLMERDKCISIIKLNKYTIKPPDVYK